MGQLTYTSTHQYPESFLAKNDENSSLWLENFIRTYIERDIPQFGFNIPSLQLRRFLTMCAHLHGGLLNSSKLGESMVWTYGIFENKWVLIYFKRTMFVS